MESVQGSTARRKSCHSHRTWCQRCSIPLPGISTLFRPTIVQQQFNRVGKAELGSVALPAIMRTGAGGPENFQVGTMPQPQLQITSGQMHRGHMPPLVSSPCAHYRAQTET